MFRIDGGEHAWWTTLLFYYDDYIIIMLFNRRTADLFDIFFQRVNLQSAAIRSRIR